MWKSGLVVLICLFVNHVEPKSREKRFLFCMNFPDCCDFKGKDNCGFACPVCPIKLDYYGNPVTTTPKPAAAAPGGLGALAALASGGGGGGGLGSLLKNPQILAALMANPGILSKLAGGAGGQNAAAGGGGLSDLLKNPAVLALLQNASQKPTATAQSTPAASTSIPGGLSGIPGFAALAQSFPGGPAELQRVLNQPAVLEFISKNPDVIKTFLADGLPSASKLQALLALAAPAPEGAEEGIFGPDIFADEEFDVQGFGDYEYEDYEDYDELDYGNFEGNDIDNDLNEEDRRGRSMDFDEKNTSKLAKLETDLKKEMSKTEKLRAEIAALKASMEKPNSDVKGRRGKKKNPTKVSKTMTLPPLARTTKKPRHCGRLYCGGHIIT